MHSFRVHVDGTVTWTLRHDILPGKPKLEGKGEQTAKSLEPSKRTQRARARAADHAALMSKAQAFRASSILRFWSRAATPEASMQLPSSQPQQSLLPPPQSTLPMPPQRK